MICLNDSFYYYIFLFFISHLSLCLILALHVVMPLDFLRVSIVIVVVLLYKYICHNFPNKFKKYQAKTISSIFITYIHLLTK